MNIRPKINANLELKKNNQKLPENFDLGGSWVSFGKGLGRSWAHSVRSWATFVRILDVQNLAFFKHGSNMGATRPFGSILGGSWKDWGRVWGDIWKDLDIFFLVVGTFWQHLEKCGPAVAKLLNWTPALIREASQLFLTSRYRCSQQHPQPPSLAFCLP